MRVLVIDDDPISRMVLVGVLGDIPHIEVHEADSGETAWEWLSGGLQPLLCCCDVHMGEMSGIDLFRRMRSDPRFAKIPMLMVTSASDRETVTDALKLGAAGFVIKPFQAADVRKKIDAALGKIMENLFENPASAIKRMGIAPVRYAAFLDSLAAQIAGVSQKAETGTALDQRALDALHTGCLTLGATYCAQVLYAAKHSLRHAPLTSGWLERINDLSTILRKHAAVVRQQWA